MTSEAVDKLVGLDEFVLSLDYAWNDDVGGRLPCEMIPDSVLPAAAERFYRRKMQEGLARSLHDLSTLEAEVLTLYSGLGELEPMTLEQIGAVFGRTREGVRQINV